MDFCVIFLIIATILQLNSSQASPPNREARSLITNNAIGTLNRANARSIPVNTKSNCPFKSMINPQRNNLPGNKFINNLAYAKLINPNMEIGNLINSKLAKSLGSAVSNKLAETTGIPVNSNLPNVAGKSVTNNILPSVVGNSVNKPENVYDEKFNQAQRHKADISVAIVGNKGILHNNDMIKEPTATISSTKRNLLRDPRSNPLPTPGKIGDYGKLINNPSPNVATFSFGPEEKRFTVTSGSAGGTNFGINLLSDNLEVGGNVSVMGKMPIYGAVTLNGNVPIEGVANVNYNCGDTA